MKHGQIGYVWSEISKTVFEIFLAQILRKLQIYFFKGVGLLKTLFYGQKRQKP